MFIETLDVFFREFGVTCVAGAASFTVLFDQPDQMLGMAGVNVQSTDYLATAKTSDVQAAAVISGSAIVINGQAFVVRDVMLVDDGVITNLTLSK